jgi:hypothetical protein
MRSLVVAASAALLAAWITTGAVNAQSRCEGDFEMIQGSWIPTRACRRHEAEHVSQEMHMRISAHPSGANERSAAEFCRGNPDIRVATFCAPYKD